MSVKVELHEVREQVAACGSYAYLLTVTDDGRPHAVSFTVEWVGDELVGGDLGQRTAANAGRSPEVSLLWPVSGRQGYALIVDGTAQVEPDGDRARVRVKPTSAVLHVTPEGKGKGPGCVPVLGHGA
jgi:hypothetical protein